MPLPRATDRIRAQSRAQSADPQSRPPHNLHQMGEELLTLRRQRDRINDRYNRLRRLLGQYGAGQYGPMQIRIHTTKGHVDVKALARAYRISEAELDRFRAPPKEVVYAQPMAGNGATGTDPATRDIAYLVTDTATDRRRSPWEE
ncbi:MAG: hypothetical protein OXE84_02980 [Rhodobacteraceae bacterium]|nr:hypothetical protein [Paracoccaceae bacterium]MCY4326904.1 hypothetical protein [Paracoccaceae bacterium]